jgi:C-terminal processing protease CtpA/Prc
MKNNLSALLLVLLCGSFAYAQKMSMPPSFNLGFEKNVSGNTLPDKWIKWGTGDFAIQKDSVAAFDGKYATIIYPEPNAKERSFGSVAHQLPANYKGKFIRLEGYMKIENVSDGYAGLLLRIDGKDGNSLEFNNMNKEAISGTHDWKKYSITLPFHEDAKSVFVAGILSGKGKAWFDKFDVFIDNQNIQDLKPVERTVLKAELDTEFEKGTDIKVDNLSAIQTENLFKLGKIWGFVKYYHPDIAKGNLNWDNELFRVLPNVLNATTGEQAEAAIRTWLQKTDMSNLTTKKASEDKNIKLKVRTDWFKDKSILNPVLSNMLIVIENSEKPKEHYYIDFMPSVGNPIFKNENTYNKLQFNDDGVKLLTLFRYWNMIEYFFPNRHLMDENWDSVLKSYIPKMIAADTELSYMLSLLEVIGKVQDTHANIWQSNKALTEFWGIYIAPIEVKIIENKVVVTKVTNDNGVVKVGDVITAIDGQKVETLIAEKAKYCPASNQPTQIRDVMRKLLRTNNTNINLTIEGKAAQNIPCEAYGKFPKDETLSHKLLADNIGYIYPATLKKGEIDDIMRKFDNTKGLVIDLRCYPSDFIVFTLGQYLMPQPTDFVKFTTTNIEQPGTFTYTKQLKVGTTAKQYYKGKIAILINETTQSQAEYTTMALRVAPNAVVIGSTTAGADGNVSAIVLPGNVRTMISGIGIYYPDGKETQRIGIVPDIEMQPTIQGIKTGTDELLNKAIEVVNK